MIARGRPTTVVLRALGLGDLCCAAPAIRAIRAHHPDHQLVLAAPSWQSPLAAPMGVDAVVDTAPLASLSAELRGAHLAVNLHGRGPESSRLLAATRPHQLIAFAHPDVAEGPLVAEVPWTPDEHEAERWCRLLRASGIPADAAQRRVPPPAGVEPAAEDTVVVHPGAASPARRWPPERFAAVVRQIVGDGHRVVLTGSSGERQLCQRVADMAGSQGRGVQVVAGRTSVAELAATVAAARLVVSGDTGVAHLATMYATPSVVLFGPVPPSEWGPPADGPHIALWAGRRGDPHADTLDSGLAQITVDEVLRAIEQVRTIVVA